MFSRFSQYRRVTDRHMTTANNRAWLALHG